jgi:PhnB protein
MLVCTDAASEIEWCKRVLAAAEVARRVAQDGKVVHATLRVGDAMIMIHGEFPNLASRAPQLDGSSPVVIYFYVPEVDAVVDLAVANHARVLIPAVNQPWGDRVCRIIDPAGHVWNIATRIKNA